MADDHFVLCNAVHFFGRRRIVPPPRIAGGAFKNAQCFGPCVSGADIVGERKIDEVRILRTINSRAQ